VPVEVIVHLLFNAGLAVTLVLWFVWQNNIREKADKESKDELEKFIRETLMKIVEDNSSLLRENQIILSKCVGVIESIEASEGASRGK